MRAIALLILLTPASCVVGSKEDVLDYEAEVIRYAYTCNRVHKDVDTCIKELRDEHR